MREEKIIKISKSVFDVLLASSKDGYKANEIFTAMAIVVQALAEKSGDPEKLVDLFCKDLKYSVKNFRLSEKENAH